MVGKYQFFKIIEYQFCGTVFVTLYFIDNDFYFLGYFLFGKDTVENNVCQQFHGTGKMFFQEGTVYNCFLLISIGIQIASYIFHAIQDMPCTAFAGSFKYKVFYKMSHPLFVGKFITRSGIDGKSAICYIGRAGSVDNTQSVWQNKSIVWHEFSSLHGFSLQKYNNTYCRN